MYSIIIKSILFKFKIQIQVLKIILLMSMCMGAEPHKKVYNYVNNATWH